MQCPCQSSHSYVQCCGRYHEGAAAPTAEILMRSRYSAYALHKATYLYRTWSAQTRPSKNALKKTHPLQWIRLEIVHSTQGGQQDQHGTVEFIAHYQENDKTAYLHETSRFIRENGRWVYVDGTAGSPPSHP